MLKVSSWNLLHCKMNRRLVRVSARARLKRVTLRHSEVKLRPSQPQVLSSPNWTGVLDKEDTEVQLYKARSSHKVWITGSEGVTEGCNNPPAARPSQRDPFVIPFPSRALSDREEAIRRLGRRRRRRPTRWCSGRRPSRYLFAGQMCGSS